MHSIPGTKCPNSWHYHDSSHAASPVLSGGCDQLDAVKLMALLTTTDTHAYLSGLENHDLQCLSYYTPRYWKGVVEALIHAHLGYGDDAPVQTSFDDLHCADCGLYVSKTLNPTHWDLICSICFSHSDECECCFKCNEEVCECCSICENAPGWCYCCKHCDQPEGECECSLCRDCEEVFYNCSCGGSSSPSHLFGQTKTAPWTVRADEPMEVDLPTIGDCKHSKIDPVQTAADFYLLDAIKSAARLSEVIGASDRLASESASVIQADSMASAIKLAADRSHRALVERVAPSFLAYGIAAVGGELRYHKAVGGIILKGDRDKAWKKFVGIVQMKGPGVLFEADQLFCEFGGGAYGGPLWGNAAKVVGRYLNGTMPSWLFVDRVFTLQHNGGCFLNKVSWAKHNPRHWGLSSMTDLLNAHAGVCSDCDGRWSEEHASDCGGVREITGWHTLLSCASPEVRTLWSQSERALTRVARRYGGVMGAIKPIPGRSSRSPYSHINL